MIHAKEENKKKESLGITILDRAARECLTEKVTLMSRPEYEEATLQISMGRE